MDMLRAKLLDRKQKGAHDRRAQQRRKQLGSGMRGDKRRTIALTGGSVVDHVAGRSMRAKSYLRGNLDGIYE